MLNSILKLSNRFTSSLVRFSLLELCSITVLATSCSTTSSYSPNKPYSSPSHSSTQTTYTFQSPKSSETSPQATQQALQSPKDSIDKLSQEEIEKEIFEANDEIQSPEDKSQQHVPLVINEQVKVWLNYFTGRSRERFQRYLNRGANYKDLIKAIFKKHGIPEDLYYLGMIESGYHMGAQSRVSATGPWQFMKGTSVRYGLITTNFLDERRDIVRSTEAAAQYLKQLYVAYQNWYLVMASYNAGEGRVLGAMMRGGSRNFWELVEQNKLPKETSQYVPKFIAASMIGKNPSKYGFKVEAEMPYPEVQGYLTPGSISLKSLASETNTSLEMLEFLNPHLTSGITPPQYSRYAIWVPKSQYGQFEKLSETTLASLQIKPKVSTRRQIASKSTRSKNTELKPKISIYFHKKVHQVRSGEHLMAIARKYNVTLDSIKKVNRLKSAKLTKGQKLIIPNA